MVIRKGTRVNVVDDEGECLPYATLLDDCVADDGGFSRVRIRLADGKVIEGGSCAWLPEVPQDRNAFAEDGITHQVLAQVHH